MKLTKKKLNLYAISEARNVIFGIVTLWIGLFHCFKLTMSCYTGNRFVNDVFNAVKGTGNTGVDVFLLLSGIGLYFSFSKDSRVSVFLKKRFKRVLPTALLIAVIFFSLLYVFGKQDTDFFHYLSRITFTYFFWTGERVFWFVSLILVMYLLFPLMYKAIERFRWRGAVAMILGVLAINFLLMAVVPYYYSMTEIALCRIPIFIFGIWMGKFVMEKREISFWWLPVSLAVGSAMLVILRNFKRVCLFINPSYDNSMEAMYLFIYRYAGAIFGLCLVLQFSLLITFLRHRGRCNILRNFFEFIGLYSLEYYMIFLNINNHLNAGFKIPADHQIMLYTGSFVVSIILCMLARKICDEFMAFMNRKSGYKKKKFREKKTEIKE